MHGLNIAITTKMDRHTATMALSDAISQSGGWVTDHRQFSNISLTIRFEIAHERAEFLSKKLLDSGFRLKVRASSPSQHTGEIRGVLTVTFIHDEPDFKQPIPEFS